MYGPQTNPQEMKNIYNTPAYSDVKKILHELCTKYGDSDENNQKFVNLYNEALKKQ